MKLISIAALTVSASIGPANGQFSLLGCDICGDLPIVNPDRIVPSGGFSPTGDLTCAENDAQSGNIPTVVCPDVQANAVREKYTWSIRCPPLARTVSHHVFSTHCHFLRIVMFFDVLRRFQSVALLRQARLLIRHLNPPPSRLLNPLQSLHLNQHQSLHQSPQMLPSQLRL